MLNIATERNWGNGNLQHKKHMCSANIKVFTFFRITRLQIKITMKCYNFVYQGGQTEKYSESQFCQACGKIGYSHTLLTAD